MSRLEDWNYMNDHRTLAARATKRYTVQGGVLTLTKSAAKDFVEDCGQSDPDDDWGAVVERIHAALGGRLEEDGTIALKGSCRWEVCHLCNGEGKTVNPSIDASGLSDDDLYDDPDFAEDYFGGRYDVVCGACDGRTTVAHWTPDAADEWSVKVDKWLHDAEDNEREIGCGYDRGEFLMGA